MHTSVLRDSDTAKRDILLHEIGHFIGLHEQYKDNVDDSCSDVNSVMNGGTRGTLENCIGAHAPTIWDKNAVNTYWLDMGSLDTPALSKSGTNSVKVEWKDNKWADGWQLTTLFNWDWETASWIQLDSPLFNQGIGFHKDAVPRTLVKEWNLQANNWPKGKWYRAEVRHWNWRERQWGPQVYSNLLYVR